MAIPIDTARCAEVIQFDQARRRHRPTTPAASAPQAHPPDDPDQNAIVMLAEAQVLLFHLRSGNQAPAACRDLEQAIRRAVAARPMAEWVEVGASTWDVLEHLDLEQAQSDCRERFDAAWPEG